MVIRFKYTVLITLILATFSSHAMEHKEEEGHTEYMVVMKNGLAEDYETLSLEFSEEETPSLQALDRYPSYKLDRRDEVFAPFVRIRELLQKRNGKEVRIALPTSSSSTLNLGIKLTFESAVQVSAFSKQAFASRLSTIIAGEKAIMAYLLELRDQHQEDFQPGTSPPHPNDPHGIIPWAPLP